jgi:O-antigen/teichoic acid export membrane protein
MDKSQEQKNSDMLKVARGSGFALLGSFVNRGVVFLIHVLVARHLGPHAFGLYALGLTTLKICVEFSKIGLDVAGMRFVSLHKDKDRSKLKGAIVSSLGISIVSGILFGILLYYTAGPVAVGIFSKPEFEPVVRLFACSVPFVACTTVFASLLLGFRTTRYTVIVRDFVMPVSNLLFIIFFSIDGLSLPGVLYAYILSHVIGILAGMGSLTMLFADWIRPVIRPSFEFKALMSYSIPIFLIALVRNIYGWSDTIMLGFLSSSSEVGFYRVAAEIPLAMPLFLGAVNSIYSPMVAHLHDNDEMQRLSHILKTSVRWVSYTTIPICFFFVLFSQELMMMYGREYVEKSHIILIILSFAQLINTISGNVGTTLLMTGKQNIQLINAVICVVINIVLNIVLIPLYGAIGTAIAMLITLFIANSIKIWLVYYFYKMHPFSSSVVKFVSGSLAILIIFMILNQYFIHVFGSFGVFLKSFELIVFCCIMLLLNRIHPEDRFLLSTIAGRFRRNRNEKEKRVISCN